MKLPKGLYVVGQTYWVRRDVPPALRAIIGKTSEKQSLRTTDLKQALVLYYPVMGKIERKFQAARATLASTGPFGQITIEVSPEVRKWMPQAPEPTGPTLSAVFTEWVEARTPTQNTIDETRRNMTVFISLNRDRVMSTYTIEHARAWRDLIAKADSAHGTKVKRFAAVTNLFMFAWKRSHIDANPFERIGLERPKNVRAAKRSEWSLDELRQWFASPIYTDGYRPKYGEAAFWIVPLGLWHGMRLGELCQMDRADVVERDGVWCMMIRPSDEDDDGPGMSVKTDESIRKVPIHRRLIEAGFIDYVQSLDGGKLFPKVRPDSRNRWSGRVSNWFGEYRKKLGLGQRWLDFHSFRHGWKTAANGARLPENLHDAITGHNNGSVGRTYGGIPIAQLKEAVDKVDFDITIPRWKEPDLDLHAVRPIHAEPADDRAPASDEPRRASTSGDERSSG
jgi:integrase